MSYFQDRPLSLLGLIVMVIIAGIFIGLLSINSWDGKPDVVTPAQAVVTPLSTESAVREMSLYDLKVLYSHLSSQHRRIWALYALNSRADAQQFNLELQRMRQVGILPPAPFQVDFIDTSFVFDFGAFNFQLIDSIGWGQYGTVTINKQLKEVVR